MCDNKPHSALHLMCIRTTSAPVQPFTTVCVCVYSVCVCVSTLCVAQLNTFQFFAAVLIGATSVCLSVPVGIDRCMCTGQIDERHHHRARDLSGYGY